MVWRKIYSTLIILIYITQSIAQEIPEADTIKSEEPPNLLMFSLSYTSNNMKTKNYEYDRIPAFLGDLSFFHKNGFASSLNYTNYFNANKNTYEAEIQFGYQKNILPKLSLNAHYAHRLFVGDTTYEGLAQKHTIALDASYTWEFLDFQISNSYLSGKSNNYFMDLDMSATIDFDNVFSENDFIMFTPTLSATFGTDYWVFQNLNEARERIVVNYLTRHNFKSHVFEYQNLSIFIPMVYNINTFGFMINWFYSWPSAKLEKLSWDKQSGLLFSIFYTPNL